MSAIRDADADAENHIYLTHTAAQAAGKRTTST
jgi:hypothetical protein